MFDSIDKAKLLFYNVYTRNRTLVRYAAFLPAFKEVERIETNDQRIFKELSARAREDKSSHRAEK